MPKHVRDLNGIDLRIKARGRESGPQQDALAELRRRRRNLRGAVIPAWERAARGNDYLRWELV